MRAHSARRGSVNADESLRSFVSLVILLLLPVTVRSQHLAQGKADCDPYLAFEDEELLPEVG